MSRQSGPAVMDDWERSFRDKSEGRRRRAERARLLWRASLLGLVSLIILAALLAVDTWWFDLPQP